MKNKTVLAVGLCAAIGLIQPVRAQEAKNPPAHEEAGAKTVIPDTVDGIIKAIHKHQQELADVVKTKKLNEVHQHAFAIRDLAKALPAKANPDMKKMVENAVKRVSQIAEDLDKSGDAGDRVATEANLKKFDAALKILEEHATM